MNTRQVTAVHRAHSAEDGVGVKFRRIAMAGNLAFDPFLLVDEIVSDNAADYIGGFPEHPHRGFDTVTIMLAGRMRHRDNFGNEGVIGPGDVQWMSAARGVLHAEMPEQTDGRLHGFQLWLNLPAAQKMADPHYREVHSADIPLLETSGVKARLIAGEQGTRRGPVAAVATNPLLLDSRIAAGGEQTVAVSSTANVLVFVYDGEISLPALGGMRQLGSGELAKLSAGDSIALHNNSGADARVLILAAEPIGEPVVHYGPFVMNTQAEIEQAINDFNRGRLTA